MAALLPSAFAEEGAKVVIAEIDIERGEAAAQSARSRAKNSGGDAHFIHCDIREKSSVEAAFAQTIERFGKLTILHNNAGGSMPQDRAVTEAPEEEFWRVIKLDLYGTFLCSKIGIPYIIEAGGGAIINMTSSLALSAVPVEYAKHKICVNAIAPSVTLSDRVKKLLEGSNDIEKLATMHLLGLVADSHGGHGGLPGVGRGRDHDRTNPGRR